MKSLLALPAALALAGIALAQPAAAQTRGIAPRPELHAINPSLSLSAPATTPLQEQMRQDYATSLMQAQRQLLQQNPAGTGRQELAIGHQLDGYVPR